MSGHGHVVPNPDGSRARCGGPGICAECSKELAQHTFPSGQGFSAVIPVGGPKEATNSQASPEPESAVYWRERAEKAEAERDATVRKLLVARGELEVLHDQRQLHGAVVHVQTETPTAAMKELERLCNEARDVANENAEKHRLARGFWFETLEQLRAAEKALALAEEGRMEERIQGGANLRRAGIAEKALADSKAEVEEWERLWNASNDVVGFLRARVASLEGALGDVIVGTSPDRRCKLCGCYVDRHPHRPEACGVAAALTPQAQPPPDLVNGLAGILKDLGAHVRMDILPEGPSKALGEAVNAAMTLAQPPAPNGNTPCGECGHPLRCHHPDLPQCSASPDCRCRGWSAQPPAEVRTFTRSGGPLFCPRCDKPRAGPNDRPLCNCAGSMSEVTEPCAKCGHKHLDRPGDMGCWACACGHPQICKDADYCVHKAPAPAQPAQGVAGERCAACGCTREQHKLELDGYSVPNRERSNYCIGFRTIDPDTLPTISRRAVEAWREEVAALFEREAEEGMDDMSFKEFCEWMAARIRALGLTPPAKEDE